MPFQDLVVTEERLAEEKVEREKPVTVWKRDKELGFGEFERKKTKDVVAVGKLLMIIL